MKTRNYTEYTLSEWFDNHLSEDYAADITEHGCAGGFPYITYYSDTSALHDQYEDDIYDMLCDMADDMGQSIPALIASFGGADEVNSSDQMKNLLVWFAIEQLAYAYVNREDEE